MNSNNHNPNIVPGYYNPQQSKTEALDYQAFLGEGFVDPTQVPMVPGDTQRPMQPLQSLPVQERTDDRAMPPAVAHGGNPQDRTASPMPENYRREMQLLYSTREAEPKAITPNRAIETIRIPIVIELTINLNIINNHGSSNP